MFVLYSFGIGAGGGRCYTDYCCMRPFSGTFFSRNFRVFFFVVL